MDYECAPNTESGATRIYNFFAKQITFSNLASGKIFGCYGTGLLHSYVFQTVATEQ